MFSAGLRDDRAREAGIAAGRGVAWLLRRAVDGGDLYDRRLWDHRINFRHGCLPISIPEAFAAKLIDILVEASASYLVRQFKAGVDAVQIFDTWASVLPSDEFRKWCIEPCSRMVAAVRKQIPGAQIIGFPRGAGTELGPYLDAVAVDAISLDWTAELAFARNRIQKRRPIQGNLDPLALLIGGAALDRSIDAILEALTSGPFIFNLGHGVLPDTPIAHVERLVARVRGAPAHG